MLFRQILNKKTADIQEEFNTLFHDAVKNQSHPGDLLLIHVNGFYHPEVHEWDNTGKKESPYAIGPNTEGHSENIHHEFIGDYLRKSLVEQQYEDYLQQNQFVPGRVKELMELAKKEANTIQSEMLIYLKIWEMDLFIKKLYQLTRLVFGEHYDWHFAIPKSDKRDNNATGKRHEIIREMVRDRLQETYPKIYSAIKNAYKTQLRNSIAHSKYSFHGRFIHLNNYIKNDETCQIQVMTFDEWIDIIHDTIVVYTQVTRILNLIDNLYSTIGSLQEQTVEVRINRRDPSPSTELHFLKQRPDFKDWYWKAYDTM